jgi:pSer/pThr/pTyr-binding forkhead associated (FHA) protein
MQETQAVFTLADRIELRLADTQAAVQVMAAPLDEGYILGRSDEHSTFVPDIDLNAHDGVGHGISRRHAALVHYRDAAHIIDLGSVNGTCLNGDLLTPHQPYLLHAGDLLRLGTLNLVLIKS